MNNIEVITIEPKSEIERISKFREGLASAFSSNKKTGFIDKTGNIVIHPIYDMVCLFHEGLAAVNKDGKWGFINKSGEIAIPLVHDFLFDTTIYFNDGLARVRKDNKCGFIDKSGNTVIPFIYDNLGSICEDMIQAKKDGKFGYINKNGDIVVPFIYDSVRAFSENLAAVGIGGASSLHGIGGIFGPHYSASNIDYGKLGFIDKSGEISIPMIYANNMGRALFKGGAAQVWKDGKWLYINKEGEIITMPYDVENIEINTNTMAVYSDGFGEYAVLNKIGDFFEGLASINRDGKWGFMDKYGKIVIPCAYDGAMPFSEGLASVVKDNRSGCINKNGDIVVPFDYDYIKLPTGIKISNIAPFNNGMASALKDGKPYILQIKKDN